MPNVTIEQAAQNGLALHLVSHFSTVTFQDGLPVQVTQSWPDAERDLPAKAITILRVGERKDDFFDPFAAGSTDIHGTVSPRLTSPAPTDLASALTQLNAARAGFEAHRVDTDAHASTDVTNVVTAPIATDLPSGILLGNDMRLTVNAHEPSASHTTADRVNRVTVGIASDLASLILLSAAIQRALNAHYVTRLYHWCIKACRQAVQLDVWATYEAVRDQIMAELEPALNCPTLTSSGVGDLDMRSGVLVTLGDGWDGFADFDFESPSIENTPRSQGEGEFRATYRGHCEFELQISVQQPRMTRVILRAALRDLGAAAPDTFVATTVQTADDPGYIETQTVA